MSETMLITKGLSELKLLEKRILSSIKDAKFVSAAKTAQDYVKPDITKKQFQEKAKADLASITALIDRRAKIKSAIMKQNTITTVNVCGKLYTVAEAVDLKTTITFQRELLKQLVNQLSEANVTVESRNKAVDEKIHGLMKTALGIETKPNDKSSFPLIEEYRKNNEYSLVDPIKAKAKIEELQKFITDFESEVDMQLQISNCNTEITID